MDTQNRLLLAITLSLIILIVYQKVFIAPNTQEVKVNSNDAIQKQASNNRIITVSSKAKPQKQDENIAILENAAIKIEITDNGAYVKQVWFKNFKDAKTNQPIYLLAPETINETLQGPLFLQDTFLEKPEQQKWQLVTSSKNSATYLLKEPSGIEITKEIFLPNHNYSIGLRLKIINNATVAMPAKYKLITNSSLFVKQGIDERFFGADIKTEQGIKRFHPKSKEIKDGGKIYYTSPEWLSLRGRYFSIAMEPKQKEEACFVEKETENSLCAGVIIGPVTIKPGEHEEKEFIVYAGPNDADEIKNTSTNMTDVTSYGFFGGISMLLLSVLKFFNRIFGNYGVAIIMLTVAINIILFPLTAKSLKSFKDMQKIQPEMEKIREEYKDNPQKQSKEMMGLYKKHKINPMGGCLPMAFQIIVIIPPLYQVLTRAVILKGANFLWIKDLSDPDAVFKLPQAIPFLGEFINILPIVATVLMFVQQKISQPKTAQADQQKAIATAMLVMAAVFFYNMPSGFLLYIITSTGIMLIMQEFVLKVRHT